MRGPGTGAASSPLGEAIRAARGSRPLFLLLDYDGTLVPIRRRPGEATADPDLLELLRRQVVRPHLDVAVVSGRTLDDLETVLPAVEGLWRFGTHGGEGLTPDGVRFLTAAFDEAEGVLEELNACLEGESWPAGTWLEKKRLSLVLHYRESGERGAGKARATLRTAVEETDREDRLELLEGRKVLEVVPTGLHKGLAVEWLRKCVVEEDVLFVAMGDDVTDERIFATVGEAAITVRVGKADWPSAARWRLEGPEEVRSLLRELDDEGELDEEERA